ncbi:MAG: EAL domain-containing protein [Burkholderiales bacterium]|nr:EAL domain-containing protein [Burkholderiales bacterium]
MKFAPFFDLARLAMRWWQRHTHAASRLPLTVALVLAGIGMFAIGTGYTLLWREYVDEVRIHAARIRNEIDTLQNIYLAANADFLEGFGTARQASFAWPVQRVGAAVGCFRRLEKGYANSAQDTATVHLLREETARWAWQLAEISVNARLEGRRASVDSARLLDANRLLDQIVRQLTSLRDAQTAILHGTSESANRHMEFEGIVLALSALVACSLLSYAFIAHYREGLARQRARLVAEENERRFREYFEHHPLPMLIFDVDTLEIITANRAAATQYGSTRDDLCKRNMASLYAQADMSAFRRDLSNIHSAGTSSGAAGICRHRQADGTPIYVDLSYHFLTYAKRPACFITAIDVTERKRAELALRLRSRALDAIGNGVLISRAAGDAEVIEYANPAFERITGYALSEMIGHDYASLCRGRSERELLPQIRASIAQRSDSTVLLQSRRANGAPFWNQMDMASVADERGALAYHITVVSDLTELIDSRDRVVMQARRDALTDLPNRLTLRELADQAIAEQRSFALLFMDLDRFKDVNDSLGHGAGDRLLRKVAERLSACLGSDSVVTRYGGDEFVAMLGRPHEEGRLAALLERVAHAFEAPISIDDTQLRVQMSIGVACYPADGADAETLLKHADLAMYEVKARGRNGIERFKRDLADAADQRIALLRRLRDAVERNAFELVYQPQIDVREHRICGVEALIRWRDPVIGAVSPTTFIPLAEENGMIEQLGEWVLRTACAQAKHWARTYPQLRMSVNVSPSQLARADFCDVVRRVLAASQLASHHLELEITEGALVVPGALPALHTLSQMGLSIAIDDFGIGYSSLSYLRTFHADRLKIDMSFVRGIGVNRTDEAIIRAVLALARNLDFQIVAEGVESADQLAFLRTSGCHLMQGYYFAKPLRAAEIPAYFARFEATLPIACAAASDADGP